MNIFSIVLNMIKEDRLAILKKLCFSFIASIVITLSVYLVYDYVANWLNIAIDNHSISILEGFDLKTKLQEKCRLDSIPTAEQLQNRFGLFFKIFLFWLSAVFLLLFAPWRYWKEHETGRFLPSQDWLLKKVTSILDNKASSIVLLLSMCAFFAFWYWVISLSGMLGDDYYCGMTQGKSLITKFAWWAWCYATHVSRIGESIFYIFPQTVDRTQHLLITPLFVMLFPFVMKRFAKASFKMNEWRGIAYYWMMGIMSFLGVVIIRILIIYAPTTNYFYPVVWCLFFWSFYYNYAGCKESSNYSTISKIAFCILGVLSGWATEGLAVIGVVLGSIWLVYWVAKERYISKFYYLGLISYLVGACNVVFSTGPIIRGMLDTRLTGGNVPYNLSVLPLWQRFTYIPEMFEAIWPCVRFTVGLIFFTIIIAYIAKVKECYSKGLLLKVSCFFIVALLLCFVYIVGAIPNGSTFAPASYVMVAALGVLYAQLLLRKWYVAVVPLVVLFSFAVWYMTPRIEMALITSKAEKKRIEYIQQEKNKGIKTLVLPYPLSFPLPETEGGAATDRTYIPFQHFSINPAINKHQAIFFGVNSISEQDWKK